MIIKNENSFLLIKLLQAGNFGSASGEQTIDSPTQKEIYRELPFIPNSALRGVIKSAFENDASLQPQISSAFGHQDVNSENDNAPLQAAGYLIIGNGDLLAFPILSIDGKRCWVIPIGNILKLLEIEQLWNERKIEIPNLSNTFYSNYDKNKRAVIINTQIFPNFNFDIEIIREFDLREEITVLANYLNYFLGSYLPDDAIWIVASDSLSRTMWRHAAEIRTLTALSEQKTAQAQSLRRIELVPEGSLFISFLTWLGEQNVRLPDYPLQVGGFEGHGLGTISLNAVEKTVIEQDDTHPTRILFGQQALYKHEIQHMEEVYKAVSAVKGTNDQAMAKSVRAIIRSFASKVNQSGFENALGFELAKTKLNISDRKKESEAHAIFIQALLEKSDSQLNACWEELFSEQLTQQQKNKMLIRLDWLGRYSEILLK